jgi:hypothetical protein
MGFARLAENSIRNVRGKRDHESLGAMDKIAAASIGGALATWNQPIEGEYNGVLSVRGSPGTDAPPPPDPLRPQSSESKCKAP